MPNFALSRGVHWHLYRSLSLHRVVPRTSPADTLRDLVALAKAQPGALTNATGGVGSPPHWGGALLSSRGSGQDPPQSNFCRLLKSGLASLAVVGTRE
jgi:hypothetical protein